MKRIASLPTLFLLAAALAACTAASGPSDPDGDGLFLPPVEVRYERIPQVNPSRAKEIKLTLPQEMETPHVVALPGGGALALGQKATYGALKKMETSKVMAAAYDAKGKALWTKVYAELEDGTVSDVKALPGGGFVFTYSALVKYVNGQNTPYTQHLVFCGKDGNVLQTYSNQHFGVYQYLCAAETGEIYAVGEGYFRGGRLVDDYDETDESCDVCIQGFDGSGKLLFCKNYGGEGYDSPRGAAWVKDAGLAVAMDIQPSGNAPSQSHQIFMLDGSGNEKWRYSGKEQDKLYFMDVLAVGGGILAEGYRDRQPFLMKLGIDGKALWEIRPDDGKSAYICLAATSGGFAAAINRFEETDPDRGVYLAQYDGDGKQTKKIKLPNETPREMLQTADGGLITVGTQNKKVLPMPAYLSSIWYDTETIVTKYDADLKIQWRKVYDKYKDSTRQDVAVPVEDGTIIIEK